MTLAEIADVTGAQLSGGADPSARVTGPPAYDSRAVTPGGLFVAFVGDHVDGHDFAESALAAGAVAVIATHPLDVPCLVVEQPLAALAALAAHVVRALPLLTVIGVTGSSGKTSTKDLIAAVLRPAGPTVAARGSSNNELGHPITVLQADESTRYLVLEMGARGIGHIAYLCRIAPPRIGVVLNVGSAHLGEFGSRAAIAQAKGELVEALPRRAHGGVAVLNVDDPAVAAMAERTDARVVGVGESESAEIRATDVRVDGHGRASFTLSVWSDSASVRLGVAGEHQVGNALAAAAVGLEIGRPLWQVARDLSAAGAASPWRMEVHERSDGVTVINDAYNANPESMRAALKTLATMATGRRSWAVLGPMNELGPTSAAEHDTLGRLAIRLDIGTLIAIGDTARPIAQGAALEGSWDGESVWVPDIDAALDLLRNELRPGDVVLVKASRAAGLERLATALLDDTEETALTTQPDGAVG